MNISDPVWDFLMQAAQRARLVPFLGAGASSGVLPTGTELAEQLIERGGQYPVAADRDLMRVAQYYQVMSDRVDIREQVATLLKTNRRQFVDSPPHRALAHLPIPLYLTTNYDDIMETELRAAGKLPIAFYPIWHPGLKQASEHALGLESVEDIVPSIARPIVYHLHGHWDAPKSIVVTEADYIRFLSIIHEPNLIPAICRQALVDNYLMFVGYSLRDWNIRILLSRSAQPKKSVAIIPQPSDDNLARFLERDLEIHNVDILWGTAQEFTDEFLKRWKTMD